MSGSNNSPSPLSTTSNQSEETPHTSSYESESNESNELEDSSSDQKDWLHTEHAGLKSLITLLTFGSHPISPASVKSDQSVAPVIAFKNSASRDKPNSPAVLYSSMARVQPMNLPLKFSREPDVVGNEAASPAPTVASFQSEQSMDPPATFSCSESYTSVMMKEHLRCSVCKDMLKEPVSIPCGHSFCKTCILYYWTKPTHAGSCWCPQCRTRFKTRPALNLNLTLANVVQTQQQAALLTQSYAGPGDVACDMCSESRIRAVKSCLTCCTSYCESHVRRHYTVEALQEHILREPTKDLEQEVYKTNTPAEVGLKDLMSNMMNEMKGLKNTINKMVKLEDVQGGITPITEAQRPRKRSRTELEDFISQVCDFAVPDLQLPQE